MFFMLVNMFFILVNVDMDTHTTGSIQTPQKFWPSESPAMLLHHCSLFLTSCCHHGRIDRYFLSATLEWFL